MNKIFLTCTLLCVIGQSLLAQQKLTIIKATSKSYKILDGDDLRQGELAPELKPDIYIFYKTNKPKKVIFYTDIDSITFTVKNGDTYNFAILLNNKDTCYQQITSEKKNKVQYIKPSKNVPFTNDTIPFVLGPNNAIHIKGKINNSTPLDLIFDTGANIGVLTASGSKKATINEGNKNEFGVAGIVVKNSPIIYIAYPDFMADGILGFNTFEDKVVEINYDKNIMIIHDSINDIGKGYSAVEMHWRDGALFVEGTMKTKNKEYKGLFNFDTGSKWALSLTKKFSSTNQLYDAMPKIGTREGKGANEKIIKSSSVLLPEFKIGNLSVLNVPTDLELPSEGGGLADNILGNDVLKRFNVILDYKNSMIYLQSNSLTNAPYNKTFDKNILIILIVGLLGLFIAGLFIYKKRKTRQLAK